MYVRAEMYYIISLTIKILNILFSYYKDDKYECDEFYTDELLLIYIMDPTRNALRMT